MSGSRIVSETETGVPISAVNFAEGAEAAVAFLTDALAAPPEVAEGEYDPCFVAEATYTWGETGIMLMDLSTSRFFVSIDAANFNGVRLESSAEFAVGDDAQAFVKALPAELAFREQDDEFGSFVYDKVAESSPWGDEDAYGGVALMIPGGTVTRIVAPDTRRAFMC